MLADPDVLRQLEQLLPQGRKATLLARDGAVISEIGSQLRGLPSDATHLVISVGGNDALRESGVLESSALSVADALTKLTEIGDGFGRVYGSMLTEVSRVGLPTAVCTIYEPRFPEAPRRKQAATALTLLNDKITRQAFARGLTLIDLRLICDEDADFANPIEPSARGGARSRRQSQSSQAAQRREALFSPISKYGVRTKRHELSRRWSRCFLPRPECGQTPWQEGSGASRGRPPLPASNPQVHYATHPLPRT
jgi:hypothetical protein